MCKKERVLSKHGDTNLNSAKGIYTNGIYTCIIFDIIKK